jgi:hypothetical protein
MGTVLASKIAEDAAKDLHDPDYDRFTQDDHLQWINDGQKEAARLKPDISITTESRVLVAGTKQELASTDISLIRIIRNMGTDGETPGTPIHFVDIDHFSLHNPGWHTDTANATVRIYMLDDRFPRNYYVYPPQPTSNMGYVEMAVSELPADISLITGSISLDDQYERMLRDYNMFRALSINAKSSPIAQTEAVRYWNGFVTALGRQDMVEKIYSPMATRGVKT